MEEACEIARLPEDLLSAALARTSPRDAFRAAAVSPAFRAAAESDEVWASFLPPGGLPPLADGELTAPAPPSSKKELFLRLSAGPVLLEDRLVSMWLDREAGSKCYMLSAWNLESAWSGDTPDYPRRVPLEDSRFSDGIQLWDVCYLKILGKIHSKMLSQDTTYAAYMVFKMTDNYYGVYFPLHEATGLPRTVCLQGNEDEGGVADNYRPIPLMTQIRNRCVVFHEGNVMFPQKRADGWMELELGEFFNEGGDDDEVSFSLNETKGLIWERGLIMQGIEIRRKKSG